MLSYPLYDNSTVLQGLVATPALQHGWLYGASDGFQQFQPFGGYFNDNAQASSNLTNTYAQSGQQSGQSTNGASGLPYRASQISNLLQSMLRQESGDFNIAGNNITNYYSGGISMGGLGTPPGTTQPTPPATINNTYQTTNNITNLKKLYQNTIQLFQIMSSISLSGTGFVYCSGGKLSVTTPGSFSCP